MFKKLGEFLEDKKFKEHIIKEFEVGDLKHYHNLLINILELDCSDWEYKNDNVLTDVQEYFISFLKDKYKPGEYHRFFPKVSKELQEEYKRLHDNICFLLYD